MKHPVYPTVLLGGWFLAAVLLCILVPRLMAPKVELAVTLPGWAYIAIILGMIAIGTIAWTFLLKLKKPNMIVSIFSGLIGFVFIDILHFLGLPFLWMAIFAMAIAVGTSYLIIGMQKSWAVVRYGYVIWNILMACVIGFATATTGILLPPWVAILMLLLAAVYDALAVWKFKSMQKLARGFLKLRIFPGLIVPYSLGRKHRFALIGGGDVFFLGLVAASFYKTSVAMVWWTALSMLASVWLLLFLSNKNRFYPALPFIFIGCVVGVLGGLYL